MSVTEVFEDLRPLMFSIAYRMLGSVADAEDTVQEAFLRYHRVVADGRQIESPKAFLSSVTTRLSIDQLRSARSRREAYIGPWLPEPVLTDPAAPRPAAPDPAAHAEDTDSLSMAFLLLLERLSPTERAVFLLHDVFDYGYDEIAGIVGKSQDNCRQLARRARRHVVEHKPRFDASRREREELAARFFAAMGEGDMSGLVDLLAADVVVYGDSGGTRPSWPRPIVGRDNVVRLVAGISGQVRELGVTLRRAEINGQPGALFYDSSGLLVSVLCLDIVDGVVQAVRSVINPDKLQHLGPLSDFRSQPRHPRASGTGE
ncbi:MAG TPA: RNA polymerase sigma-70 factor [Streptosporangiaceae bacterium]|nr:RNA polymerase sigma-70 factor [Streptosporangiaceae bacterium]